ncbi:MAG: threonine synthase [Calditrichales bacterium]|nr:MAG: threonine synthase [Calditrichales bacterium]
MIKHIITCVNCGKEFTSEQMHYTCDKCGDIAGTLEITYNYDQIKPVLTQAQLEQNRLQNIFRYLPLLPIGKENVITGLRIGMTPLSENITLAQEYNVANLYLKDDSFNPSLTLKDRASAISLIKAREFGYRTVATASTGNAAASMACLGAHMGLQTVIFVPESIPPAKRLQLQVYGAKIVIVKANYDAAFDLFRQVSQEKNWYNRSTAINPYNIEGKKTVAFEICEQLDFKVPDLIFVPVGDGSIISGVWKGLKDFYRIGLIDHLPRLVACQSEGSAAIANAFKTGQDQPLPVKAGTLADSISVDLPRDGVKAVRALRESQGDAVTVNDPSILQAQQILARQTGIFCEPSAAAAFAGFQKYHTEGKLRAADRILLLLTGSGMKDLASAEKGLTQKTEIIVDPVHDDVHKKLEHF